MATVTKKFRDDFELWAADRIAKCEWTSEGIEELRAALRIDFAPGPDQLRAGCSIITAAGVEMPSTMDDHEERYRFWANFFAAEADAIRRLRRDAA